MNTQEIQISPPADLVNEVHRLKQYMPYRICWGAFKPDNPADKLTGADYGMIKMPEGTKAWFICRALHLVDCTHASEDGRFFLIDFPNGGPKGYSADSDCVFMTNEAALECLAKLADYWSGRATFMHGVISGQHAKITGRSFVNQEDLNQQTATP